MGPPLGIGGPGRHVSIAGVVFTPAREVIHPSFPLGGRWKRCAKSDEQAPSPSLVSLYISSFETPTRDDIARTPPLIPWRAISAKCCYINMLETLSFSGTKPNLASRFNSEPF